MKVLVVGAGGREHCIALKCKNSKNISDLFVLGKNAGCEEIAKLQDISFSDISSIVRFASSVLPDITIVGPETPLSMGIVDEFRKNNLKIFGPAKSAARLEASKIFAKELFAKYSLPTAKFEIFDNSRKAISYIEKSHTPIVIKADGLCAGKGVVVAKEKREAIVAIEKMMDEKIYGASGEKVVIEEFLTGEEFSYQAITDGEFLLPLLVAQDYKRIGEGNTGPNTGGMGSYAPCPWIGRDEYLWCKENILDKTLIALNKEGINYSGVLYAGLIKTKDGPKLLEYNCRFGDPETQVVLPLLESDFLEMIYFTAEGCLHKYKVKWKDKVAICVILASMGYPEKYETGKEISGLEDVKNMDDIFVFHAGTKKESNKIITTGGRVLGITSVAENFLSARKKVYSAIEKIKFENMYYRRDIGMKVAD